MWNNEIYISNGTSTQTTIENVQSIDHVRIYNYILDESGTNEGLIDVTSGLYIRKTDTRDLEDLVYNNEYTLTNANTIEFNEVKYNTSKLYLVIEDNLEGFGDGISELPLGDSTTSDNVSYDNTISGLTSDNVKEAIDEVASGGTDLENVTTNIVPDTTTTRDLGIYQTKQWNKAFIQEIQAYGTLILGAGNAQPLQITSNSVRANANTFPISNGLTNLGLNANRWGTGYINNLYCSQNLYCSSIKNENVGSDLNVFETFLPVYNTKNLGSVSSPWGDIFSVNAPTTTSDERMKKDIIDLPIELGSELINLLNPISYRMKDTTYEEEIVDENNEPVLDINGDKTYKTVTVTHNRRHLGLTTQQFLESLTILGVSTEDCAVYVKENINDPLSPESLRYQQLIPSLIFAHKQHTTEISELKSLIEQIKIDNNLI